MTRFVTFALSFALVGSLALVALTPPSAQLKARENSDCRQIEVPLDEGYGITAMVTQQVCKD
ncbi:MULTISPECIES: hypothetical protein [unclassified Beijerinckia]|uniref:hypothetical protein n=1 Tax=unclassified Beijerinckia TaxID=2638183 RepID=UPI000899B19D|nr:MULTISPECIES: hypothetical protein [unclassified Beijerinckia]MDH7794643.1 hypothetical protein [Beijerinckia sp. GAS462]SEB69640.1 hypothetical protein SAMN05443249_0917 [Beijerinckia sp. 28-YEA-48]